MGFGQCNASIRHAKRMACRQVLASGMLRPLQRVGGDVMKNLLVSVLLLGLLGACASGIRVSNDYDPQADFVNYKLYTWYPAKQSVPPDAYVSELVVERIERAVDDQLQLKGMQKVAAGKEQVQVRVYLVIEDKLDVQTWNASYGYHRYNDPWGWGMGTETTVHQYKQGTLIVDLVNAQTGRLFWRGTAESRLRRESTPQEREARIREVVAAIMNQYPPAQ